MDLSGVKSWNERLEGTGRMGVLIGLLAMSREAFLNGVIVVSGIKPRACLMERSSSFSFWISCERSFVLSLEMITSISRLARVALALLARCSERRRWFVGASGRGSLDLALCVSPSRLHFLSRDLCLFLGVRPLAVLPANSREACDSDWGARC